MLDKLTELSDKEINVSFLVEIISRNRDVADNKIDESIQIREKKSQFEHSF